MAVEPDNTIGVRSLIRSFLTLIVAGAMLAGCATSRGDGQLAQSQALWQARTAFVGDSSRVGALVSLAGPAPEGQYTLRLQTDKPPYGLTINVLNPDKPCADLSVDRSQTLILGLIANLDRVTVTCQDQEHTATAAEATRALGFDIKALGRDRTRLDTYLKAQAE